MTLSHVHLLLNHVPVFGTLIGLCLLMAALMGKSDDLKRASLVVLLATALLTIPTYMSGNAAQFDIRKVEGISKSIIVAHENAALLAYLFMEIMGGIAWFALWEHRRNGRFGSAPVTAVLILGLVAFALIANAAGIGGAIRHPEILSSPDAPASPFLGLGLNALAIGHFVAGGVRWAWATCQTLHFIGLSLLLGIVFVVDLRVLGVMRSIPFSSVHRLLPWGMLGFGLNLFTGTLYFLGAPEQYINNETFYWKITLMMLAGANATYLTVFNGPWELQSNQDAPFGIKCVAASTIFLWLGVLFCGLMLPFIGNAF
jgi:hypothetical protein